MGLPTTREKDELTYGPKHINAECFRYKSSTLLQVIKKKTSYAGATLLQYALINEESKMALAKVILVQHATKRNATSKAILDDAIGATIFNSNMFKMGALNKSNDRCSRAHSSDITTVMS